MLHILGGVAQPELRLRVGRDDALLFLIGDALGGLAPFLRSQVKERLLQLFTDLRGYIFIVEV